MLARFRGEERCCHSRPSHRPDDSDKSTPGTACRALFGSAALQLPASAAGQRPASAAGPSRRRPASSRAAMPPATDGHGPALDSRARAGRDDWRRFPGRPVSVGRPACGQPLAARSLVGPTDGSRRHYSAHAMARAVGGHQQRGKLPAGPRTGGASLAAAAQARVVPTGPGSGRRRPRCGARGTADAYSAPLRVQSLDGASWCGQGRGATLMGPMRRRAPLIA